MKTTPQDCKVHVIRFGHMKFTKCNNHPTPEIYIYPQKSFTQKNLTFYSITQQVKHSFRLARGVTARGGEAMAHGRNVAHNVISCGPRPKGRPPLHF